MTNWEKNAHTIKYLYQEILTNKGEIRNITRYRLSWNIQGKSKNRQWVYNLVDINKVCKNGKYYV